MTSSNEDPTTPSSSEETNKLRLSITQKSLSSANTMLSTALSAAVPLWIYEIYERGGPTPDDWKQLKGMEQVLAEHGDALLFRSSHPGKTAEVFNTLAEALALLAFLPGGVPFGGQRFDALQFLTHLLGEERANSYLMHVRQPKAE